MQVGNFGLVKADSDADRAEEEALRGELGAAPFNFEPSRALAALLYRRARPPLPDEPAPDAVGLPGDDIDALVTASEAYARDNDVQRQFACLWQACVRHPADPRGFAEYARAFARRHEWANCLLAVRRAFARPQAPGPAAVEALLAALATLAEHGRLDDLDWQCWLARLPELLQVNADAVRLLAARGDARAATLAQLLVRARPELASTWLAAAMAEFDAGRFSESYGCLHRALAADTPATLHTVIRDWSAPLCGVLTSTKKIDELDAWLTERHAHCPDLNLVPGRPSPEAPHAVRRSRGMALDRGLPPFAFVAGGKTASATVSNIITSGFELPTVLYSIVYMRVVAPWLTDFLRGGSSYTTHLLPSPENIERLVAGGVKRLIVHVRDPRQVFVSHMEHIRRYPREVGPELREIFGQDRRAALDAAGDHLFSYNLAWLDGWAKARKRLDIHFTSFEEFVRGPRAFVDRLVALYGGDTRWFNRAVALHEPTSSDFHRRRGEIDEWRRLVDRAQTERLNAQIPDELWSLFGWTP